jgi:acyl carrier protein
MTREDGLIASVCAVIASVVGPGRVPPEASAETVLADGGLWLDSVELLQVIATCETEFGIVFDPATDLLDGSLATLGTLTTLIRSKKPLSTPASDS